MKNQKEIEEGLEDYYDEYESCNDDMALVCHVMGNGDEDCENCPLNLNGWRNSWKK